MQPQRREITWELWVEELTCKKCRRAFPVRYGSDEVEELEVRVRGMKRSHSRKPRASLERAIRTNERRLESRRVYLAAKVAEHEARSAASQDEMGTKRGSDDA